MNRQTKARAIAALIQSAAELASDLAGELSEAAAVEESPEHTAQLVGAAMHAETQVAQLAAIVAGIQSLNRVAVAS